MPRHSPRMGPDARYDSFPGGEKPNLIFRERRKQIIMKKNVMMRLASFLLVAVLISTSAISGTYAKYVTADEGSDKARVAKWGVVASVDGTLFSDSYQDEKTTWTENEEGLDITVQAKTKDQKVVAPGTENNEGITVILTGTPEVDVKVEFKFEATKEIKLAAGTYTDYTKPSAHVAGEVVYDEEFTLDEDYYPVVFTLTKDGTQIAKGNVAAIQAKLTELSKIYDTNTDLAQIGGGTAGKYVLTWAWAFGNETGVTGMDRADTYLGNETALQEIDVKFSISATQVD